MSIQRIYQDACCLNRPFDDQTQERIRLESEAVRLICTLVMSAQVQMIGSSVLLYEIQQAQDPARRVKLQVLAGLASMNLEVGEAEVMRGEELEQLGFQDMDALHLACAESARVDCFLTTDDRLLRLSRRKEGDLRVRVLNPLKWLEERLQIP